ncbi:MAG: hypothetical protein P9L99_18470 [Candidatus Lernaella stagnicola]|nr:hypothetical protein [Candidatus Lernaella stagnicola]
MRLVPILLLSLILLLTFCFAACGDDDDDDNNDDNDIDDDDDDNNDDDNDTTPATDDDDTVTDDDDNNDDDTAEECDSGLFLSFNLTEGERNVPFPSLTFMERDEDSPTGFRTRVGDELVTYLAELWLSVRTLFKDIDGLDGFGVTCPVWFHTAAEPDLSGMSDGEPSLDDPIFCAVLEDAEHAHYGELWRVDTLYRPQTGVLELRPHFPFPENTTMACVATTNLRPEDGDCYERPAHLSYVLSDAADPDAPDAAMLEPHRQKWAPFLAELEAQYGVAPSEIVGASFFHTQWVSRDLMIIHEKLADRALTDPPTPSEWRYLGYNHPNVDSMWETDYQTVGWLHDGKFAYDADSEPITGDPMDVTARLMLPKKGINGHEGRFPVVIYGHGIQSSRGELSTMGRTVAGQGFATISIDWVYHGARTDIPEWVPEPLEVIYRFLQFYNVLAPLQCRDTLRQDIADLYWLKHLIRELDEVDLVPYETGGDGIPDLDTSTIYYMGHSHGGIHGGVYVAVEPDVDTFMFNAGAENYRKIITGAWYGEVLVGILKIVELFSDDPLIDKVDFTLDLISHIIEPADGYAYANLVMKDPLFERDNLNLLLQMAAYDNTLGGPGCSEMARGIGLTLLEPYPYLIEDIPTALTPVQEPAVFIFDTHEHSMIFGSGGEFYEGAHNQLATFMRTAYDDGVATIISPLIE